MMVRGHASSQVQSTMGQCLTCKNEGPSSAPLPDGGVQVLDDSERHPCKSIYIGETSFSAFHRGLKHVKSMYRPTIKYNMDPFVLYFNTVHLVSVNHDLYI